MPYLAEWRQGDSYSDAGNFTNEDARLARMKIATEILALQRLIAGP